MTPHRSFKQQHNFVKNLYALYSHVQLGYACILLIVSFSRLKQTMLPQNALKGGSAKAR